jgi:hypothetical protein
LRELGDARVVNAGMTQVHTMPIMRNTLIAGLISSIAILSWTSSTAQIQTVVPNIQGVCCQMFPEIFQSAFLSMNDLKAQLEQANVTVDESMQPPSPGERVTRMFWGWPSVTAAQTRTLDLHFPDMPESETIRVQAFPGLSVAADGKNPKFVVDEDVFIDPLSLIDQLKGASLPMLLEGWINPTVRIGQTVLVIGTQKQPVFGASLYADVISRNIDVNLFPEAANEVANLPGVGKFNFAWSQPIPRVLTYGRHIYSMRVNDRPGTVYSLFVPSDKSDSMVGLKKEELPAMVEYSLARVNDQGVLQFVDGSAKVIEFVKSFKGIADDLGLLQANKYDPARLGKLGYGSAKRPAKVMLVRLTGRLDANTTEIVVPEKTRLMASPR